MTKQELTETYTAEQLAEMVVELQKDKNFPKDEPIYFSKEYMGAVREFLNIDTSEIKDDCHRFSVESLQKYLKIGEPRKVSKAERLQSEVEKYRKAFEEAKKERDCQIAEYQKKIEELEHDLKTAGEKIQDLAGENMKLQCERNDYKTKSEFLEVDRMRVKRNEITDFLPTEPIKVADMLIHNYKQGLYPIYAKDNNGQIQNIEVDGKIYPLETGEYEEYTELRQIAEHLLVYCNHNEEAEE